MSCVTDALSTVDCNPECLATVRLISLSASSSVLPVADTAAASISVMSSSCAGLVSCDVVRQCLLPLVDTLLSAGSHVYLSTTKLHRAMMMMVALTNELSAFQGLTTTTTATTTTTTITTTTFTTITVTAVAAATIATTTSTTNQVNLSLHGWG